MTEYNVYIFTGIPDYGTSGSVEVQKMSLLECFENVFSKYYERNMKDFFDRSFSFAGVLSPAFSSPFSWLFACLIMPLNLLFKALCFPCATFFLALSTFRDGSAFNLISIL